MDDWNTTKTLNCGDISICMECGKEFDEDESPHMFFCSDDCELIFRLKAWREAQIISLKKRMEDKQ